MIIEARACYAVQRSQASGPRRNGVRRPLRVKNGRAGGVPKWSEKGATAGTLGYAPPMPSPSSALRAILPTGRVKWLWLGVAGALGVWLVILLATSGRGGAGTAPGPERASSPLRERIEAAESSQKPFDRKAADAFTQRQQARARRPSRTPPLRVDQGQSK